MRKCTSEELSSLGLAPPARPVVPKAKTLEKLPMAQRLGAIQKVGPLRLEPRSMALFYSTAAQRTSVPSEFISF